MSKQETPKSCGPTQRFRGMMPIMATAVTPSGSVDEASQRRIVQYCLQCGAVAIGHFGIASEFHKISHRDRHRLIELIIDEVDNRVPVFIGVTSPGTRISTDYAREAEALGAELIMSALPSMVAPEPDAALAYFDALSQATALPIIIQDTPSTSSTLTVDLMWRMARQIERIEHVKAEGTGFLQKTAELLRRSKGQLSVIGGAGGRHLIHLLRLGVTAFMTGTEALELHGGAVTAYLNGDEDQAAELYFTRILPYLEFYWDYSEELLKLMLHERGVIDCPDVIAPRASAPVGDAERRELNWVLDRIGWRKSWPRDW